MGKAKARLAMQELTAMHNNQDEEQELSRTQIKNQMHTLQEIGKRLIQLKPSDSAKIPMSESLQSALEEARRLTQNEAKRRHLQFIGKIMRTEDTLAIQQGLALMDSSSDEHRRAFHQLEKWRDGLIAENEKTMQAILDKHPQVDRQHLHTLVRQAKKEAQHNKSPTAVRKIFKYLRQLAEI